MASRLDMSMRDQELVDDHGLLPGSSDSDAQPVGGISSFSSRRVDAAIVGLIVLGGVIGMALFSTTHDVQDSALVSIPSGATEDLIMESHMSQSCSYKCNFALWTSLRNCTPGVQGCKKPAESLHEQCCNKCPENRCDDFCSFHCNLNLVHSARECYKQEQGLQMNCANASGDVHEKCCDKCPHKTCIGRTTQLMGVKEHANKEYKEYIKFVPPNVSA